MLYILNDMLVRFLLNNNSYMVQNVSSLEETVNFELNTI